MRIITADQINARAPYHVTEVAENAYAFITNEGVRYSIGFMEDSNLGISDIYHFYITNIDNQKTQHDPLLSETVFVALEEFFNSSNRSMLYLCDMHDNRQAVRNRLFVYWFANHAKHNLLTLITREFEYQKDVYYTGLILRNDNPQYSDIINTFNGFLNNLPNEFPDSKE